MQMDKQKLGDIATVEISGVDKKTKDGEQEIRLCNFVDVYYNWAITTAQHDGFMFATARPNEISKFQLKKGQVALTKDSETRDDIGVPTYIADDFDDVILGYHCALITPNKDILDGRYLNALLHTDYAKKYFACNASGSGQRYALSVEALNSFPVPMIPLRNQERIGEIFSALDKKIELNRRINQNLEAMVKQLYDYWFVQFDFPNEEGKPYKSSGGEMVWNEKLKREIPKRWKDITLNAFIDKNKGGDWGYDTSKDGTIKVGCVRGADIDFLINVPVLKGHCQTKITCALKNMKGLIPNTEKRHFHAMGLHEPIAHLNAGLHQDFVVVDNICGDLDFEDGGNPVVMNRI